MKKLLLILLFTTAWTQGQTLQNPTYGNTTTNTLKIKNPATVTSVNFLPAFDSDGTTLSRISSNNFVKIAVASNPSIAGINATNLKLVGLGDSITYGYGSTSGNTSYLDIINSLLGFGGYSKLAVSSTSVMPTSGRPELYTQVSSIPSDATLITVMAGTNDIADQLTIGDIDAVLKKTYASLNKSLSFAEAYRYNLETIKRNFPDTPLFVLLPIKMSDSFIGNVNFNDYLSAEIAIANYLSIPVVDMSNLSGIMSNDTTLMPDGLHPNDAGQTRIAYRLINQLISPQASREFFKETKTQYLNVKGKARITGDIKLYTNDFAQGFNGTAATFGLLGSTGNQDAFISVGGTGETVPKNLDLQPFGGKVLVGTATDNSQGTLQVNGNVTANAATLSNQVVIKSQLDAAVRPYKVYTALLNQTGTNAPTATVLENNTGLTVSFIYASVGKYQVNFSTPLTDAKSAVFLTPENAPSTPCPCTSGASIQTGTVGIFTKDNSNLLANGALTRSTFEVRIYP